RLFREALRIFHSLGVKHYSADSLSTLAEATADARPEWAARLCGAAATLYEEAGYTLPPQEQESFARLQGALRTTLGEERFATEWATGQKLTLEQAVEMALDDSPEIGVDC